MDLSSSIAFRALRQVLALILVALAVAVAASPKVEVTSDSLSLSAVRPGAEVRVRRDMNFEVEYYPADEAWVSEILSRADNARRVLQRSTPDVLLVTIRILLAPDRKTLVQLVGPWAENSAAVAIPRKFLIIVNADAMRGNPSAQLATTLVHEFAHVYLGARCREPLPRWLDEGLAMHIAGEWSIEDSGALVLARLFGGLIPLRDLTHAFPTQADRQRLAYRESYSMVHFLAGRCEPATIKALIASITGNSGREQIAAFWNPVTRDLLEASWKRSLRAPWNWLLISFNGGLLWGGAAILLIIAWLVRRRRSRLLHAEWEEEERIYQALDEEEDKVWADPDTDEALFDHDPDDETGERRPPWYD